MTFTLSPSTMAQDLSALERAWRNITPSSCPSRYNFHMHSVFSDGRLTPEQIVDQAIAIGLEGFAITDHHTVKGFHAAQAYLDELDSAGHQDLPHLWTGIEINGVLSGTGVHILGYGFDPEHNNLEIYRQREIQTGELADAHRIVRAIQNSGGMAVLAHPARYRRPANELIPAAAEIGMNGIEAYYAYDNPKPWRPSPQQTDIMEALGKEHQLWLTCGTDTHGENIRRRV